VLGFDDDELGLLLVLGSNDDWLSSVLRWDDLDLLGWVLRGGDVLRCLVMGSNDQWCLCLVLGSNDKWVLGSLDLLLVVVGSLDLLVVVVGGLNLFGLRSVIGDWDVNTAGIDADCSGDGVNVESNGGVGCLLVNNWLLDLMVVVGLDDLWLGLDNLWLGLDDLGLRLDHLNGGVLVLGVDDWGNWQFDLLGLAVDWAPSVLVVMVVVAAMDWASGVLVVWGAVDWAWLLNGLNWSGGCLLGDEEFGDDGGDWEAGSELVDLRGNSWEDCEWVDALVEEGWGNQGGSW